MSDIFREVDEDIRQEKYRRLWDRLGPWVIAVAVLIVVGTGGYRGWLYWQETQADAAGSKFLAAVQDIQAGNTDDAEKIFAELQKSTGGYPALADLRAASAKVKAGDAEGGLAAFDAIAVKTSIRDEFRDIARLRAAMIALDTGDYAAVADRAEPLTTDTNPFRAGAREILAVAAWKAGDVDKTRDWIKAIEEDPETPSDVTRRITLLKDVLVAAHGTPAETSDDAAPTDAKAAEGDNG